ncbi:hypothetical protein YC2023_044212 [Brassica napus]
MVSGVTNTTTKIHQKVNSRITLYDMVVLTSFFDRQISQLSKVQGCCVPSYDGPLRHITLMDFKITYVPRVCNQFADFLVKTARIFRRELLFIGCSIPVWLPRPPQA